MLRVFLRHVRSGLTSVHSRTGLARCGSGPQGVPAVPGQLILREAIPATLVVPNSRKSGLSPPFVLWWHPGIPDLPSFEDHGVRAADDAAAMQSVHLNSAPKRLEKRL